MTTTHSRFVFFRIFGVQSNILYKDYQEIESDLDTVQLHDRRDNDLKDGNVAALISAKSRQKFVGSLSLSPPPLSLFPDCERCPKRVYH